MNKRVVGLAVVGLAGLVGSSALAAVPSAHQRQGRNELISMSSQSAHASYNAANNNYTDLTSDMSADGRYVVFSSAASNLVPADTNQVPDVFMRDRATGKTTRVSTSSSGDQAISPPSTILSRGSGQAGISRNGRYVAFSSDALNLVAGDTNVQRDVFLKDTKTGRLTRVSVANDGSQFQAQSILGDVSDDGRFVSFSSTQTLAVLTGAYEKVFVRDVRAGRTLLASGAPNGGAANGDSGGGALSADGRYLTFVSSASNLVSGDTNGAKDVFWHDMKTGRTFRVSVASDGSQAVFGPLPICGGTISTGIPVPGLDQATVPSACTSGTQSFNQNHISADGRYVTFYSNATNLVPNDSNFDPATIGSGMDTFVHDVLTHRTERVSVTSVGHDRFGYRPTEQAINDNGRYVTFSDYGQRGCVVSTDLPVTDCLVRSGTNDYDAKIYDRWSGTLEEVVPPASGSPTAGGCAGGAMGTGVVVYATAVSPTGRYVSLASSRTDLVPGDTNNACDIFVRDRGPEVGTGGLGYGSPATPLPQQTCVIDELCLPSTLANDSQLVAARVVPRPSLNDLFVRVDVAKLPSGFGPPTGGRLYGVRFTVGGALFEVRAQRIAGADLDELGGASFGLFRQAADGLWDHVASLNGGYGTVGDSVVTAVPLSLLGGKAQLTDVTAYTAVGDYLSGPTKILDSLRLTSRAGGR